MSETQVDLQGFTVRPYRMKRLKEYCSRMSKDSLDVLYDDNVADALKAQGYVISESPRSVYKVTKLYEALSGYDPRNNPEPIKDDHYLHGIRLARICFARPAGCPKLTVLPFTPETISLITSNPSGSAGLTAYGCTKAEAQTRALERGLQTLKGIKQPEPCLAFKRTQFNDKTRLVWGYPYSMTAIEGLVAKPLIELFKKGTTPMSFAMTSGALGTKLRVASYHKRFAYSLDMSQFDATISSFLIHQAFSILKTWYDLDEVEPISGCTVSEIFGIVEKYFIRTTIVMPDSNIYIGKNHGVPSGSYFTQMVDSVVNVIIGGAISSRFNLNVSKREIFVLGDDLMFWSNRKVSLDVIAAYAKKHFGVKLHGSEKSRIFNYNETLHYLGRDWSNGLPSLSIDEIVARMVYPERWRKYSDDLDMKKKQVRMLILSFAANYYAGWRIAYDLLDGSDRNIHQGCANLDVNTYCYGVPEGDMDPDHLSGLQRFKMKYLHQTSKDIPNTAMQYWL